MTLSLSLFSLLHPPPLCTELSPPPPFLYTKRTQNKFPISHPNSTKQKQNKISLMQTIKTKHNNIVQNTRVIERVSHKICGKKNKIKTDTKRRGMIHWQCRFCNASNLESMYTIYLGEENGMAVL